MQYTTSLSSNLNCNFCPAYQSCSVLGYWTAMFGSVNIWWSPVEFILVICLDVMLHDFKQAHLNNPISSKALNQPWLAGCVCALYILERFHVVHHGAKLLPALYLNSPNIKWIIDCVEIWHINNHHNADYYSGFICSGLCSMKLKHKIRIIAQKLPIFSWFSANWQ